MDSADQSMLFFWGEGTDSRRFSQVLDVCADLRHFFANFLTYFLVLICCGWCLYLRVFFIADHYHCCPHKIPHCWIQRWSICLSIVNWKNMCLLTYILTFQILHYLYMSMIGLKEGIRAPKYPLLTTRFYFSALCVFRCLLKLLDWIDA